MRAGRFFAPDLLKDDVALVTGGGTGIGKAIAIALVDCGAKVVIASRGAEHLEQGAADILTATGSTPLTKTCDIRDPDQTDIDCGGDTAGSTCPDCNFGQDCNVPADCSTGGCQGTCSCGSPVHTFSVDTYSAPSDLGSAGLSSSRA